MTSPTRKPDKGYENDIPTSGVDLVRSRTFTEIAPAFAFFVIPGCALSTLAEDLRNVVDSNKKMLAHYQVKKDAFA